MSTLDPPAEAVIKREPGSVVWREEGPGGERAVVKLYRRRGAWTALRSRLIRFRTEREYHRLRHLVRTGVPCTEPLAWGAGRSPGHGHCEVLVTREIPNAVPLDRYLEERGGRVDLVPLLWAVRRMHEGGFCDQTLYARNVLVDPYDPAGPRFYIADVPRSWRFPRSIADTSMAFYDLFDLTMDLTLRGVPPDAIPFDAYGSREKFRRFRERRKGKDPRTKPRRLLRDAAARARWVVAWCAAWTGTEVRSEGGAPSS